jgi:hypothetical protein
MGRGSVWGAFHDFARVILVDERGTDDASSAAGRSRLSSVCSTDRSPSSGPRPAFGRTSGLRLSDVTRSSRRRRDRPAPLRGRPSNAVPEDGAVPAPHPAHTESARRARPNPAAPRYPLLFPASRGGYIGLDTRRNRDWYPALEAAGIDKRRPYHLRHTLATEALAAGVSIFELARLMGASVKTIDMHYGHLARESEDDQGATRRARFRRAEGVAPVSREVRMQGSPPADGRASLPVGPTCGHPGGPRVWCPVPHCL